MADLIDYYAHLLGSNYLVYFILDTLVDSYSMVKIADYLRNDSYYMVDYYALKVFHDHDVYSYF